MIFCRKATASSENIQGSSSSVRRMEIGSGIDSEVTDNRELNRRNAASKTKFVVKIFVNGKQVKLIIHVIWVLTISIY